MKFVAMEMASILQNISQNRTNKTITITDIKYTVAAAYLSFFPGKTFYNTAPLESPLGYSSSGNIYCIKGFADGKACVLWARRWHSAEVTYEPSSVSITGRDSRSLVKLGTNVAPSDIYKDLKINEGEIKIIIEAATHCYINRFDAKKTFGFYIYPFKGIFEWIALPSVVIFTPKPGLFSENPPQ